MILFCLLTARSQVAADTQQPQGYYFGSGRAEEADDVKKLQIDGYDAVKSRIFRLDFQGTTVYIHECLWQGAKIKMQRRLYHELSAGDLLGPAVDQLEAVSLEQAGMKPGPKASRRLVLKRSFSVQHGGRSEVVQVWSSLSERTKQPTEIPCPSLVEASVASDAPASPWVRYPTAYGGVFVGGPIRHETGRLTQLRIAGIKLVEDHLDEFARAREKSLDSIKSSIDAIDLKAILNKKMSELPTAMALLLRTAAGSALSEGARESAIVTGVASRLYLEEREATGKLVDLEVP